jgi:hypothetical protein
LFLSILRLKTHRTGRTQIRNVFPRQACFSSPMAGLQGSRTASCSIGYTASMVEGGFGVTL